MVQPQEPFDESLLTAYLDNELSPEERIFVEKAVESSPSLQELLAELSQIRRMIAQCRLDVPPLQRSLQNEAWSKEPKHSILVSHRTKLRVSLGVLAALAASSLLYFSWGLDGFRLSNRMKTDSESKATPIQAPPAGQLEFQPPPQAMVGPNEPSGSSETYGTTLEKSTTPSTGRGRTGAGEPNRAELRGEVVSLGESSKRSDPSSFFDGANKQDQAKPQATIGTGQIDMAGGSGGAGLAGSPMAGPGGFGNPGTPLTTPSPRSMGVPGNPIPKKKADTDREPTDWLNQNYVESFFRVLEGRIATSPDSLSNSGTKIARPESSEANQDQRSLNRYSFQLDTKSGSQPQSSTGSKALGRGDGPTEFSYLLLSRAKPSGNVLETEGTPVIEGPSDLAPARTVPKIGETLAASQSDVIVVHLSIPDSDWEPVVDQLLKLCEVAPGSPSGLPENQRASVVDPGSANPSATLVPTFVVDSGIAGWQVRPASSSEFEGLYKSVPMMDEPATAGGAAQMPAMKQIRLVFRKVTRGAERNE